MSKKKETVMLENIANNYDEGMNRTIFPEKGLVDETYGRPLTPDSEDGIYVTHNSYKPGMKTKFKICGRYVFGEYQQNKDADCEGVSELFKKSRRNMYRKV